MTIAELAAELAAVVVERKEADQQLRELKLRQVSLWQREQGLREQLFRSRYREVRCDL